METKIQKIKWIKIKINQKFKIRKLTINEFSLISKCLIKCFKIKMLTTLKKFDLIELYK